jgi:hypothetical protein
VKILIALLAGFLAGYALGYEKPSTFHCTTLPNGTQVCAEE